MKMPKRILILGILYILFGVLAIVEMIMKMRPPQHIHIAFHIFLLPVGIGLLRGKSSSLKWAKIWVFIGYFICAVAAVMACLKAELCQVTFNNRVIISGIAALPYVMLVIIVSVGILRLIHKLLDSEKSRAYCLQS